MSHKVIIPFKCSQCDVEFSELRGGICYFCNKVFCSSHLLAVVAGKKDVKYVCQSCKVKYIDRDVKAVD